MAQQNQFTRDQKLRYHRMAHRNYRSESKLLEPSACLSLERLRRRPEPDRTNIRPSFAHDADRIIHCQAYTRYIDKTQVFFLVNNDHITRRVLHVQIVSKIARTIGRCLGLNLDLIEAIALGHDIGHAPFGHTGEEFLAELLEEAKAGSFVHNAQSVRMLDTLENDGKGLNLTIQVLDGVLGHNGEILSRALSPCTEALTWAAIDERVNRCLEEPRSNKPEKAIYPSTLEGCVVRVADVVSYIGRDIEDAITLKLIERDQLPDTVTKKLGNTTRDIIDTLVMDLLYESRDNAALRFSEDVFRALESLMEFNNDKIYKAQIIEQGKKKLHGVFRDVFHEILVDLEDKRTSADVFTLFLNDMPDTYKEKTPNVRIVADFVAGMTDSYLLDTYSSRFVPARLGRSLARHSTETPAAHQTQDRRGITTST